MTTTTDRRAATRRRRSADAWAAVAARSRDRRRRAGHCPSTTLGSHRGHQSTADRRVRRPRPLHAGLPPQSRRLPDREDLRRRGTRMRPRSRFPPSRRCRPWSGCRVARIWWSAGPPAPARRSSSKRWGRRSSRPGCRWRGSPSSRSGVLVRAHRADDSLGKAVGQDRARRARRH